jgi:hypothetical protein
VRDSVAEYIQSDDTADPIDPKVEGRLVFLLMNRYLFLPTLLK